MRLLSDIAGKVNAVRARQIAFFALLCGTILTPLSAEAATRAMRPTDVTMVMELDSPIRPGEYAWDESGAPVGGGVRVVVDLSAQKLYVYRGGVEIGRTFILYGVDDRPTPLGTFPILQKDADHRSSTYGDAPMPYTLRLTWDGVSIHGSDIDPQYGTHGCIGVPVAFAKLLFAAAHLGDSVLVTRDWMPAIYAPTHLAALESNAGDIATGS
ncbi:lipoprotein-anchoring transpeptidase ErfK/SrfK [Stakelama pacifica]|uniref:Lipoprotein-anchoring transpeptidase ErfK/SrfK n=2 Tax=Stakelama pacifica TaxID=517720 RepID=A0A4V3BTS4_9SPHN|nr:lipoprotein-anchoring transpeptidase ErfK/SrfK [Stakelama pacifica]